MQAGICVVSFWNYHLKQLYFGGSKIFIGVRKKAEKVKIINEILKLFNDRGH